MSLFPSIAAGFGITLSAVLTTAAAAQAPAAAAFVTTLGVDTVSVEQFGREGNTIRGVWAAKSALGTQLYYYEIIIGADGRPAKYSVLVRAAGSTVPAAMLPSLTVQYGRDTAVFSMQGDVSMSKRVAMSGAYPRLGTSVVGIELALGRLRAANVDASTIVVNSPLGPSFDPIRLPVLFVRPDSVRLTSDLVARLDADGKLIYLHDATRETRRAVPSDIGAIIDAWTSAGDTPGIRMSLSELQRFVGHYSLKPDVQITIERVGSSLVLRSADGSLDLIAQTATTFKVSGEPGVVEFETNAAGDIAALVLVNGGTRQRAPRVR